MTTEQAAHQMELVTEFLKDDREEEDAPPGPYAIEGDSGQEHVPGPYEQGANQIKRDSMSDLFGDVL
jgi:hypothetical protein